jgi:hypothetical protein
MKPDWPCFVLNERDEEIPATLAQWQEFMEWVERRQVAHDIVGPSEISTTFIGRDPKMLTPPRLYEVMVLSGPCAGEQQHHTNRAEALAAHATLVRTCRGAEALVGVCALDWSERGPLGKPTRPLPLKDHPQAPPLSTLAHAAYRSPAYDARDWCDVWMPE